MCILVPKYCRNQPGFTIAGELKVSNPPFCLNDSRLPGLMIRFFLSIPPSGPAGPAIKPDYPQGFGHGRRKERIFKLLENGQNPKALRFPLTEPAL